MGFISKERLDENFLQMHIPNYAPLNLQRAATHSGSIRIGRVK
jgi:hypothetical protein